MCIYPLYPENSTANEPKSKGPISPKNAKE